jgi:DNA polymerase III epsilon subunit family exonuclease
VSELIDLPADRVPIVALDFETTGLHASRGDRVIEVAAIRREPDGSERILQCLVHPGRLVPIEAQKIHGIDDSMLVGAPSFGRIAAELADLMRDAVFLAHNLPFDKEFLLWEHRRLQLPTPLSQPEIDTLELGRHALGLPRCNLTSLAARVGIEHRGAHRALNDARSTLGVFMRLLETIDPAGVPTIRQLHARIVELRRGSPQRRRIGLVLRAAARDRADLEIDYTSLVPGPLSQRRRVTARRVNAGWLEGWCHMRDEERRFRLERIHRAVRLDAPMSTERPATAPTSPA